jgi:DNA replication protein DnaC
MAQFVPCRNCATKPGPQSGFYFVRYKNSQQKGVVECECHKQFVLRELLQYRAVASNLWPQAFDYNIDTDYVGTKSVKEIQRLKKYVFEFPSYKSVMLYMYGPNGTQKSTLAHWVGVNILHQGYSVKYLLMQSLLMTISGFEKDEVRQQEKQAEIEKLKTVDLLIVDEAFSKDKVTIYDSGYQLPFLDRFLRERCEIAQKGIIFISNKPPGEIEKQKFSASIQDFVMRNTDKPAGLTRLYFEDNYKEERAAFEPRSLFDEDN